MTWTYSGNPTATPKDALRFEVGDVGVPWLFTDEEIAYIVATGRPFFSMAADLLDALAVRYAMRADLEMVGDIRAQWMGTSERVAKRAAEYRRRAVAYSGIDGMGLADGNYEREPYVWTGMFDNPEGTPGPDALRRRALLGGVIITP